MHHERRLLEIDASTALEVHRLTGSRPGPEVAVLGGVHGDEPEGTVAVRRLVATLAGAEGSGRVTLLPVASPHAAAARSRLSPADGRNLARCFPGCADGTSTERIAHAIDESVIAGSELLVDLHSAGLDYRMPWFVGAVDDGTEHGDRSVAAAASFGAPLVWLHPAMNPGRSISAAWARQIPAIYVESGGGGVLREADLDAYVGGVLSVLAHLGVTGYAEAHAPPRVIRGGDGNVDVGLTAPVEGWCVAQAGPGALVLAGEPVATILGPDGVSRHDIAAPGDGCVMMIRQRAPVTEGEVVAVVAPAPSALGRADSDPADSELAGSEIAGTRRS